MLVRLCFGILALIISMNSSMAASPDGIKAAIDEFTYSMTVEGAILDPVESEKVSSKFRDNLLALEAQGFSREEIIDTALNQVADEKSVAELKQALIHIQVSGMSSEEAGQFLRATVERSYQQGASWNGWDLALQVVAGIGIVAGMMAFMLGLMYVVTRSSDCPTNYNEEQCRQWDENVKW